MLITLVIPNLNSGAVLERAIQSVLQQDHPEVQLILADGESTDVSRTIADRYCYRLDPLIRRRDGGQADALNHAFRNARGDIHGWLCADDELLPGALSHVAAMFEEDPRIDLVAGACERVYADGTHQNVPVSADAWELMGVRNGFDQPSVFWRSALKARIGELDTSYDLAFDWDFWCRMRAAQARLRITPRVLSRYYFSAGNKTSTGGTRHVDEGYRIVRRYGPYAGRIAAVYRMLYRHFDLPGCMDDPPSCSGARAMLYAITRAVLRPLIGERWLSAYNWHFASLQERRLKWWGSPPPAGPSAPRSEYMLDESSPDFWWSGVAEVQPGDEHLPGAIDRWSVVLNRRRLTEFLAEYAEDADVRDLLLLDAALRATGRGATEQPLALWPFHLWECTWLCKGLGLREGGKQVLQTGGALSLPAVFAALAGNHVTIVDGRERTVAATNETAAALGLANVRAIVGDVRRLAGFLPATFDRVFSCAFLQYISATDQPAAVAEMRRLAKPEGGLGLTFHYGPRPNPTIHFPPPHDPPASPSDLRDRLLYGEEAEQPIPGSLFRSPAVQFTIAALFLANQPATGPAPLAAPSLLGALVAPDLPRAAYRSALQRALREEREVTEKQTWVTQFNELNARLTRSEQTAQERLAVIERHQADTAAMRAELAMVHEEARKRLQVIEQLDAHIKASDTAKREQQESPPAAE